MCGSFPMFTLLLDKDKRIKKRLANKRFRTAISRQTGTPTEAQTQRLQPHALEDFLVVMDTNYGYSMFDSMNVATTLLFVSKGTTTIARRWRSKALKFTIDKILESANYCLADIQPAHLIVDTSKVCF